MVQTIDVNRLMADAKKSCCSESYIVLERNQIVKIGIGAKFIGNDKYDLTLDITINLCPGTSLMNTKLLEKSIALARELKALGYELDCQDGQVISERAFKAAELNPAYQKIVKIFEELDLFHESL
ncbi:MAG: hypothetical protein KAJ33_06760 [Thermoplasmata archaeon]|nr:hypothetical protein [Thermoplasmata archaeon]MCK5397930.1 hypothetical protein [Thermoplasmata archaeon]